MPESDSGFFS